MKNAHSMDLPPALQDGAATVRALLMQAHQYLQQGEPVLAFQMVVRALEHLGGAGAAQPAVERVLLELQRRPADTFDLQQLIGVFGAISLGARQSSSAGPSGASPLLEADSRSFQQHTVPMATPYAAGPLPVDSYVPMNIDGGLGCQQPQPVRQASEEVFGGPHVSDSYMCPRCRGLVSLNRRQQHEQYWCQNTAG